jgi:hypothetical protein
MKTFREVTRTQQETAGVLIISLSFILLLVGSQTVPNIIRAGMLREIVFYVGFVFGLLGFLAIEIFAKFSFLGDGAKFGVLGFLILLVIGAWTGGRATVTFVSASIVGWSLFYGKSVFAIYRILSIETQPEEPALNLTEQFHDGVLNKFKIEGIGANFELLYYIVDEFKGRSNVMFYARITQPDLEQLDLILGDTMRFYSNHMLPLHRVDSKRTTRLIKQMCFEGASPEIIQRGLINYWLRAHLNGGYTCVLVPYESNFIEKAAACEGSNGEELPIRKIMNGSDWLMKFDSLMGGVENHVELYTVWERDEVMDMLSRIHPIE